MAKQVILQENFPTLGYVGDVVNVRPGYARNFLIPRGIAVDASSSNGKLLQHRVAGIQAKRAKLKNAAEDFGKKLQEVPLNFTLKLGEGGKAFGAVTSRDIEAAFKAAGFDINKKQIRLFEPLKTAGAYKVDIKVHAEVTIAVPVNVQSEAPKKAAKDAESGKAAGAKKKGGAKAKKEAAPSATEESAPEENSDAE